MDNKIRRVSQHWSRDSSVGVMSRLRAGGLLVLFLVGTICSLLQNMQTSSGAISASYEISTGTAVGQWLRCRGNRVAKVPR